MRLNKQKHFKICFWIFPNYETDLRTPYQGLQGVKFLNEENIDTFLIFLSRRLGHYLSSHKPEDNGTWLRWQHHLAHRGVHYMDNKKILCSMIQAPRSQAQCKESLDSLVKMVCNFKSRLLLTIVVFSVEHQTKQEEKIEWQKDKLYTNKQINVGEKIYNFANYSFYTL